MTVAYQSTQSAGGASAASVTITKAVSLAVGDEMIAHIVGQKGSTGATVTAPAGWTQVQNDALTPNLVRSAIFTKIADAADVAATNFTFTFSATMDLYRGSLSRFTKNDTSATFDQVNQGHSTGFVTALTNTGITPQREMSTFLILVAYFWGSTGNTVASYSIANQNPTWTEAYDGANSAVGNEVGLSMAYGSRPTIGASGTASATSAGSVPDMYVYVLDIAPPAVTPALVTSTPNPPASIAVLPSTVAITSNVPAPTVSEVTKKWTEQVKSATPNWNLQSKSS